MLKSSVSSHTAVVAWREATRSACSRVRARLHRGADAVAGCAVGPDFSPPTAPAGAATRLAHPKADHIAPVAGGAAQRFLRGRDIPGEWWNLFRSRQLRSLVEQALINNQDLQAAQAALRVARENAAVQRGAFFPQVDGGFSATRQRLPADINGEVPAPSTFNVFTGQVSVSYVPDVFGANWRAVESLDAQAEVGALPARGDASDIDVEHRPRRRAGGFVARPDRGDGKDHQDRCGTCSICFAASKGLGRSLKRTWWRRRQRLPRSSRRCRRCNGNWIQQRHLLVALIGGFPSTGTASRHSPSRRSSCRKKCRSVCLPH